MFTLICSNQRVCVVYMYMYAYISYIHANICTYKIYLQYLLYKYTYHIHKMYLTKMPVYNLLNSFEL